MNPGGAERLVLELKKFTDEERYTPVGIATGKYFYYQLRDQPLVRITKKLRLYVYYGLINPEGYGFIGQILTETDLYHKSYLPLPRDELITMFGFDDKVLCNPTLLKQQLLQVIRTIQYSNFPEVVLQPLNHDGWRDLNRFPPQPQEEFLLQLVSTE